ncbi:MAG: DUF3126 family protein [Hyphomicrobiaceae bacterium]|nr:DUF3126 family protein [Hyphomicrobiaceae bacterium]
MNAAEITKLETYLTRLFRTPGLQVRARPRKADSVEVYIEDEFIGLIHKDEDDDYNFTMAILDIDLD